jgi:hypothetical protein
MSDNWPKHEDGTNKMIGDMEPEERREVLQAAAARYRARKGDEVHPLMDVYLKNIEGIGKDEPTS